MRDHTGGRSKFADAWLTDHQRLTTPEVATTAVAVVVSASLYLREGHPYLARGVVGDLLGFSLLSSPLIFKRRRARHEALVCLGSIAFVRALNPYWPLRRSSSFWWTSVAAGLLLYSAVRSRSLAVSGKQQ